MGASTARRLLHAVLVSLSAMVGFVAVFAVVGAIIAGGGRWLVYHWVFVAGLN